MIGTDYTIVIRPTTGGCFTVTVEPPHPQWEPHLFFEVRTARGFASGIKLATGWPKRDKVEAEHG